MQRSAFAIRLPFLIAVAIVAAALADPVVESFSNAGFAGGHYADNDHAGVVPTLVFGTLVALYLIALRCFDILHRARRSPRAWLTGIAREYTVSSTPRDFPLVFGLQLGALFVMESAEQLLAAGSLAGGTLWLGGPAWFSLGVHALFGAIGIAALGRLMRAVVGTFAALVGTALRAHWLSQRGAPRCGLRVRWREMPLHLEPARFRRTGERAPPLLLAPI